MAKEIKTERIYIRLSAKMKKQVEVLAQAEQRSVSNFIEKELTKIIMGNK